MTSGSRAVRRARVAGALGAGLVLGLSGCGGIGQPAPYDSRGINGLVIPTPSPVPADFVTGVDNAWLSLEPGARWTYEMTGETSGEESVRGTVVVEVLDGTVAVAGLDATVVETTVDLDRTTRTATDIYAQDEAGNVWLVGGDADGVSWRAGEAGAEAGLAMPADPRLGDGWLLRDVPGLPRASRTIEDQSDVLVQVLDEAGTTTRRVYEEGAGLVGFEDLDAGWTAELVGS
ncbi:hypothetical protein [Nocardioides flavus (ex Wang et al. 2016)]|nr:hypothetical protein [Nocardioides flavus (ex Wang et al. 2016)]